MSGVLEDEGRQEALAYRRDDRRTHALGLNAVLDPRSTDAGDEKVGDVWSVRAAEMTLEGPPGLGLFSGRTADLGRSEACVFKDELGHQPLGGLLEDHQLTAAGQPQGQKRD